MGTKKNVLSAEEIKKLRAQLNSKDIMILSEESFVSKTTIYKYFSGGKIRDCLEADILQSVIGLLKKKRSSDKQMKKELNQML